MGLTLGREPWSGTPPWRQASSPDEGLFIFWIPALSPMSGGQTTGRGANTGTGRQCGKNQNEGGEDSTLAHEKAVG